LNKYRVVFHLDETRKDCIDRAFKDIYNLLDDLGEKSMKVELVEMMER